MPAASLYPAPKFQGFDSNGNPLSGGLLYTYTAGTTTPLATYTDSTGNTPNANPVVLDSRGEANVWFDESKLYKVVLKTSAGVTIYTADNVGGSFFTASGTGAVTRTVQAKLRDVVSVKDFGAVGDGVTDDVAAVQAAVDALNAAGGGSLYFPTGTYRFAGTNTPIVNASRLTDGVTIYSNISFEGDGPSSEIALDDDCCYAFTGRLRAAVTSSANNLHDIQFRNLRFTRPATTFFQEQLTLFIDSCENLLIENCQFVGWSGDAIMLGGILNSTTSAFLQSIIKNARITGCFFDGVDKENRQAISLFNGENVEIDHNVFLNTTRTDMPGAIDIEPELATDIVKNISIHDNQFTNIGGFGGVIGCALSEDMDVAAENIAVYDNQIDDCTNTCALGFTGKASADPLAVAADCPIRISFERNKVSNSAILPFSLRGADQLTVADNIFSGTEGSALLGVPSAGPVLYPLSNVTFTGNIFRNCKVTSADATKSLISFSANVIGGVFSDNEFINCGVWSNASSPTNCHTFGFETASDDSSYLTFAGNTFNTNGTLYSSTEPTFYAPSITLANASTILLQDNTYIGITPEDDAPSMYAQCVTDVVYPPWTPTLSGFNYVGGNPTVTGVCERHGRIVVFTVKVVPAGGGTVENPAGTGYITNLPYSVGGLGGALSTVADATGFVGTVGGYFPPTSTQCYPAAWTASGNTKVITGTYLTA